MVSSSRCSRRYSFRLRRAVGRGLGLAFLVVGLVARPAPAASAGGPGREGGALPSRSVTVAARQAASEAYRDGFAWNVMRRGGTTVCLSDLTLLENDGPGSGRSEKGTHVEEVSGGVRIRKTFFLRDVQASQATLYLLSPLITRKQAPPRFFVLFNGTRLESAPAALQEPAWHVVHVPVRLLKTGHNVVVVGCDAPAGRGLEVMIAREDEYADGGGPTLFLGNTAVTSAGQLPVCTGAGPLFRGSCDEKPEPFTVGSTSEKSTDGGRRWVRNRLGVTDDVQGEYVIRLSLHQYQRSGVLVSPVIDLWSGADTLPLVNPPMTMTRLALACSGVEPRGAAPRDSSLVWQVRFSGSRDPFGPGWNEFAGVGSGASVTRMLDAGGRRFMQWRVLLRAGPHNTSPAVLGVEVRRTLQYTPPRWGPYSIISAENPAIRYSSFLPAYERWDEPQLARVRSIMKLDSVVAGAAGDFEKINRVRHHVSRFWPYASPEPQYPEWNTLAILGRNERLGSGGMCIQYAVALMQSLLSLGYQARHINVFAHETIEVYVDELRKWVHVDATEGFDSYEYRVTDGMPLSALEQHASYLAGNGYSPRRPIDWRTVPPWQPLRQKPSPFPLGLSTLSPQEKFEAPQHRLVSFLTVTPRNDFLSRPFPRPAMQGRSNWPWNGYLHWYDAATPRREQYFLHTDREADLYPSLNSVFADLTAGNAPGEISVSMTTCTPNFDTFEVKTDETEWEPRTVGFTWKLRPGGVNTLAVRVRNKAGVVGAPSMFRVIWHNRGPFTPRRGTGVPD